MLLHLDHNQMNSDWFRILVLRFGHSIQLLQYQSQQLQDKFHQSAA